MRRITSAAIALLGLLASAQTASAATICAIGPTRTAPTDGTWGATSNCQCGTLLAGIARGRWVGGFEEYGSVKKASGTGQVWLQVQTFAVSDPQQLASWSFAKRASQPSVGFFTAGAQFTDRVAFDPDAGFNRVYRSVCAR